LRRSALYGPFVPKIIDTAIIFMYYDDGLELKFKFLRKYIERTVIMSGTRRLLPGACSNPKREL